MDVRLQRARAIVRTAKLRQRGNTWLVPSQSGRGKGYVVAYDGEHYRCDCPDFEHRHSRPGSGYCKHIYAVCLVITQTQETTKTEETCRAGSGRPSQCNVERADQNGCCQQDAPGACHEQNGQRD